MTASTKSLSARVVVCSLCLAVTDIMLEEGRGQLTRRFGYGLST